MRNNNFLLLLFPRPVVFHVRMYVPNVYVRGGEQQARVFPPLSLVMNRRREREIVPVVVVVRRRGNLGKAESEVCIIRGKK